MCEITYLEELESAPDEERHFYVYAWFEKHPIIDIPFYIGKGSGNRYKDTSNRNDIVKSYISERAWYPLILVQGLTNDIAYICEDAVKRELKRRGFKIIDFEHSRSWKQNRTLGTESKSHVLGRPAIKAPDNFEDIYSIWKSGKITAKEAMERTGLKRTSFYKLVKQNGQE